MMVSVKVKLRAAGPLIPDRPNHCCPVLLIEGVLRINEEVPPVLLLGAMLPRQSMTTSEKYWLVSKVFDAIIK